MSDCYQLLEVGPDAACDQLFIAYQRAVAAHPARRDEFRHAYKALADPFFSTTYQAYRSLDCLVEAGFFDDGVEPEDRQLSEQSLQLLTTPWDKLSGGAKDMLLQDTEQPNRRPAVLLMAGAFSPIHAGHLEAMERAKAALLIRGVSVAGGYFSPSHDAYVSMKYQGTAALSIERRLLLAQAATDQSDWLMVDPWEGHWTQAPVNYTDVIDHLNRYLAQHTGREYDIYFVVGGDNAAFARAFIAHGHCLVVPRAGFEDTIRQVAEEREIVWARERIIILDQVGQHHHVSALAIREDRAESSAVPETVAKLRQTWAQPGPRTPVRYALRDDLRWATSQWNLAPTALDAFRQQVVSALREGLEHSSAPESPRPVTIELLDLSDQQAVVDRLQKNNQVILLDQCLSAPEQLSVSRVFALAGGQLQPGQLIARPGSRPLKEQLAAIPAGDYLLVDDDIASGWTMRAIEACLPKSVTIIGRHSVLDEVSGPVDDVCDLRDFLVGAQASGLVVALPDEHTVRVPYLAPFVRLATRASLVPETEMRVSRKIWQANRDLFATSALTVADADNHTFWEFLGWSVQTPLANICQWHLDRLTCFPYRKTAEQWPGILSADHPLILATD